MKGRKTPRLRFKEFYSEWSLKNLGEITTYTKGFAFKSEDYRPSGIRIIRVSDLGADAVKEGHDKVYIDRSLMGRFEKYNIKADDIVITTVGSRPDLKESAVGRGIYISEEHIGLLNQNLLKFNSSIVYDNKFIFSYINSSNYIKYIKTIQRGNANQSNITVKDLLKYEVYTTSYQEQQKIAAFLTAVDDKIEQLSKKKALLEQYKKGVMQQIFSQHIRFKDESGGEYPQWDTRKLGKLTIKVTRKNKGLVDAELYSVTNSKGFVLQADHFDRLITSNDQSSYRIIKRNEFAYNPARINVGSIAHFKDKVGLISSLYVCFSTATELNDDFLEYVLTLPYIKHQISSFGEGGVRIYLWYDLFSQIKIQLPSLPEQAKIANILSALDNKLKQVDQQIELTKQYKKGLLQQMFV